MDSQAATKLDLEAVERRLEIKIAEVKSDIVAAKADLKTDIANVKNDTIRWVFGLNIAMIGILFAAIKLFK